MELSFLGRGAAFNPKEGNNSAYFIDNDELFLIDCGESVFERIIASNILSNVSLINVMITHTHSDHVGSLGTLINYCFYALNKSVNIILPNNDIYLANIKMLLELFGCNDKMYSIISEDFYNNKYESFKSIKYISTKHCENFISYGLIFETSNGILYYSGDTNEIDIVKSLIANGKKIDKLYLDTTNIDIKNNAHLYIGIINEVIPKDLKSCVYCMHLNSDDCIKEAINLGFNVVELKKDYDK